MSNILSEIETKICNRVLNSISDQKKIYKDFSHGYLFQADNFHSINDDLIKAIYLCMSIYTQPRVTLMNKVFSSYNHAQLRFKLIVDRMSCVYAKICSHVEIAKKV